MTLPLPLQNGSQVMIPYYEGMDPDEVAHSFTRLYDLSEAATIKLRVRALRVHGLGISAFLLAVLLGEKGS